MLGSGLVLAMCAGATVYVQTQGTANAAPDTVLSVDFTKVVGQAPAGNFGVTFSTFAVDGGPVVKNPGDIAALRGLGVGGIRVHLAPNDRGEIVSGAGGGDRGITGHEWLSAIEAIGAEPTVVVNADRADALAVLGYLNQYGHHVKRFVIGNEMDENSKSKMTAEQYTAAFRTIAAQMRARTPGLEIGGPATAYFDEGLLRVFVDGAVHQAPPQERASFVDFHAYGAGNGENATVASSIRYTEQLDKLRTMLGDAPGVGLQIGEFNMNWGDESQHNTHFASLWVANAFGSIVTRGATAMLYADKNDAMGLLGPNGTPKASYVGMEMFTGSPLGIRHFGRDVVEATSSNPDVRVYASNHDTNIVVVNTGTEGTARIELAGALRGSVDVWQSSGALTDVNRPTKRGSVNIADGGIGAFLPGMSITTFVVNGLVTGTPGTDPSAAPTDNPTSPSPAPSAPAASTPPPGTPTTPTPTAPGATGPSAPPAPGAPPTAGTPAPGQQPAPNPPPGGQQRLQLPDIGDPRWRTQGSATAATGTAVLTRADQQFAAGSLYYDGSVPSAALQVSFDAAIGGGKGGDGMTLAFLDPATGARVGEIGGGLGYSGLTGPAVVFDTFDNTTHKSADRVGYATSAQGTTMRYAASTTSVPSLRATHHYEVAVAAGVLTVRIDGTEVLRTPVTLPTRVVPAFTAATGETTDQHRVSTVKITHTP
ncbi:hypothetical protein [Streptodolium elevatio]